MTKKPSATSDNGFVFEKINENQKRKEKREKKILGAIEDLPANQQNQFFPIPLKEGSIGCAD